MKSGITDLLIDLDGVLIGKGEKLFPVLGKALRALRETGVKVRVVTSRPFIFALPAIEFYGLDLSLCHVFDAGSLIRNQEEVYKSLIIPSDVLSDISLILEGVFKNTPIQGSTSDAVFANSLCSKRLKDILGSERIRELRELPVGALTIGLRGLSREGADELETLIKARCRFERNERDNSSFTIFIRHKESSKLNALRALEKGDFLTLKESMFVTDDDHDADVFECVQLSGVPSNAETKAHETATMRSNLSEGEGCFELIRRVWPTLQL